VKKIKFIDYVQSLSQHRTSILFILKPLAGMADLEQQACHKHRVTRTMRSNWVQINLTQTCTNPRKSCAPSGNGDYILCRGSSVWNFLHGTLLAPRILRRPLDLSRNCEPLIKLFMRTTVTHTDLFHVADSCSTQQAEPPDNVQVPSGLYQPGLSKNLNVQKWECQDHVYGCGAGTKGFVYKHT